LPDDIKQKVQSLLTANANNPKLQPQTRQALQSLLATPAPKPYRRSTRWPRMRAERVGRSQRDCLVGRF